MKYNYLLIGNGKVSRHFSCYFKLLGISFVTWARCNDSIGNLRNLVKASERILVLIKDDAIEDFILSNNFLQEKILIHFSGTVNTKLAIRVHPLMSFTENLYDFEIYKNIYFVTSYDGDFGFLLKGLPNKHIVIPEEKMDLYHSLCVIGGNFSCMLMQKFINDITNKCGIPKEASIVYLKKIFENVINDHQTSITGPVVRNDKTTIKKNLFALKDDDYLPVYKAFVEVYDKEKL